MTDPSSDINTHMKKLTTEQFIERSREIHGNTYDYTNTIFNGTKKSVNILCPNHGSFTQLGINHLRGMGCLQCGIDGGRLTRDTFIERATVVHGDRYDYSNVEITGADNKVSIVCSTHGVFFQRAADHMAGRGCSLCNERQQLSKEQFVKRANEKHSLKYLYDEVVYKNVTTKVLITCPTHGNFTQTPKDHMRGDGCPTCGGRTKVTTDSFIERSQNAHGTKYDYTNTIIKTMNTTTSITCLIHGEFKQRPADHVNGAGCPECSLLTRGRYSATYFDSFPEEKDTPAILYLVAVGNKFCKVGISKRTVAQRFGNRQVHVVEQVNTTLSDAYKHEQHILEKFATNRFRAVGLTSRQFSGWTECFNMSLLPRLQEEFLQLTH